MPPAKKQKSGPKSQVATRSTRPTTADLDDNSEFAQLAKQHWLKGSKRPAKVKVKKEVLKEQIWDVLEKQNFAYKALLTLEGLQILEQYLWPGYNEDASDVHVLLLLLVINVKKREHLETWDAFTDRPADFSSLFRRILSMSLDSSFSFQVRTHILSFIIHAFQSLDCAIVRKECAPLVSVAIWHNISSDAQREELLDQASNLRRAWRASAKRYDAADDQAKARLRFDRLWLYSLVLDFVGVLVNDSSSQEIVLYCERFIEFLADLQSQLPTRRHVNALLHDLHVVPALAISPVYNDEANSLFRDLCALFSHYTFFSVDDQTGAQLSQNEAYDRHCAKLAKLQRVALRHFKDKLMVLALSNYGSIDKRTELEGFLEPLSDEEVVELANLLHLRTTYPPSCRAQIDRKFLTEVLLCTFERRNTFQETARELRILPTEETLFEKSLGRTDDYDGSRPLALPKLNLQYLSVGDFLWRSLILYRCEAFYAIKQDIDGALKRLKPELGKTGETVFTGMSRMAFPIQKPSILQVVPPLVGEDHPSLVKAEISIDFRNVRENIRREWEALRPDDTVFLVAVNVSRRRQTVNGGPPLSEAQKLGITCIRTAEVIHGLENNNNNHFRRPGQTNGGGRGGFQRNYVRRLQVKLDPVAFVDDTARNSNGEPDVYESINLIVRRSARENNFKPVLDSIQNLVQLDVPLAPWLHEVFLGYGDPAAATYKHLPNRIKAKIDFRDTFLDWHHLIESLPGKIVEPGEDMTSSFGPPYVLGLSDQSAQEVVPTKPVSKKRRRDAEPTPAVVLETVKVSTYKPPSNGPYPVDAPKLNTVRFTPAQTEAIISGTQPGLTVIVGPPGTGKTDVATQIINNIYHNFPEQRTLLIAHSNQALNQLFAKIVALDIDERHLLRLGHGEEELDLGGSFSKYGRVEMFLENRNRYLLEVTRLAASIGAPGAHGNSAETAGYFNLVYIAPAWARFTELAASEEATVEELVQAFPFHQYFADAPQPLFPVGDANSAANRATVLDIAQGCYRHIEKIFSELADVLPFEILRRERDKANYLLTKEARIIAMTSTHAAMRRSEIAGLGFHYDNVVIEEAAQITEIETFIPLSMQKSIRQPPPPSQDGRAKSGAGAKPGSRAGAGGAETDELVVPLQRVIMCGDHLQNSPIVQNLAFRDYANLEQSLFARLVRLGVPTIRLDQQGRARPSIAELYRWRYPGLGDLPQVQGNEARTDEYSVANAGFKYDYQFINVPDYRGHGEAEPSPHFIQNLGEAEYAVAIYQYMRLLGYPASKISILTTYAGQRALVRDVLDFRCRRNPIFGMPKAVSTVDKYQGEQNDYIILSLTRTSRVGYLRDIRRLTVALSRARLGLYVLGRRSVFETCQELREAFELLLQRPDKLTLVTGELWPTKRLLQAEEAGDEEKAETTGAEAVMESVEHLGQYVFEMTQTKIRQLQEAEAAGSNGGGGDGAITASAVLVGSSMPLEAGPLEAIGEEDEELVALPDEEEEEDGGGEEERDEDGLIDDGAADGDNGDGHGNSEPEDADTGLEEEAGDSAEEAKEESAAGEEIDQAVDDGQD